MKQLNKKGENFMKKSAWQRVDFDGYYTFKNTETGEVLKKQFVDLPYDENHKKSDIDLINEMSDYKIVADAETEGWFVFNASQNKRLRGRAVTAVVQCHKDGQNNYENIYRIDREKDITYFLIIDLNRNRILKTMMMGKKSGCLVLRKPQNIFYNNFDLYVGSLHPFILYDIFNDKSWKLESNLGYLDDCLVVKLYDEKKYRYFDIFTKTLSKPLKIYSAVPKYQICKQMPCKTSEFTKFLGTFRNLILMHSENTGRIYCKCSNNKCQCS